MESADDDFGDLYADVEVKASSAINGVLEPSNLCNGVEKHDSVERTIETNCNGGDYVGDGEENASESEDDFDIVLNDDDCDGFEFAVNRTVDREGKEEIEEEAKDVGGFTDKSRVVLDHFQGIDAVEQRLSGGDRRNGGKGCISHYKYMRPQSSTLAGTLRNSKCEGPVSYSCPSLKGDQEDNGCYHGMRPKLQGGQSVHQFTLPRSRTIVDVNIDAFDEKPWRHPGADITDFFNFDFDEESWKNYCNHLDRYRHGDISPKRVLTSDLYQHNGFYESRTDHETVSQAAAKNTQEQQGRIIHKSKGPSQVQEHSNMHKGRAIQVAGSITERQSSMDTRRLVDRDSDVVIQINVQESNESGTSNDKVERVKSPEQDACENGTSCMDDDMVGLSFGSSCEDDLYKDSLVEDSLNEVSDRPNSKRCSVQAHLREEAALCDSVGNINIVETTSQSKEDASRSTRNTAPTIPKAGLPDHEGCQYSQTTSFSSSDCEDFRDGAPIDVKKSYNYVKRHAPNSLTGFQKSATHDYHHPKDFRGQFSKRKYRDCKGTARCENINRDNGNLYGTPRSKPKSYASGYKGTSDAVCERDYDIHLEYDHNRQGDKLYGYGGYREDEFLLYKERELSISFCDERFPDYQMDDMCTRYPRKKGYQRLEIATGRVLPKNSDTRTYRQCDDMIKRDWDDHRNSFAVDSMQPDPLTCQESRHLNLNYPETAIDTRWETKGDNTQFVEGIQNDVEFFPEQKYLRDSPEHKYRRTGPYKDRGKNCFILEYEEHLPYSRRANRTRSSRRCMEDENDFWRSSHYQSFSSRPDRGTRTLKSRWFCTSSPKSDAYERIGRQERYEKSTWIERSQNVDIYDGENEAYNTEPNVIDHDDRAYSSVSRHHDQSELLHWSEDEGLLRQQNNSYHAETTSFSLKRTSWNERFTAEDSSGHVRSQTYDKQVDQLSHKWMSDRDAGKQWYRNSDSYYGGDHEQTLFRCRDSVDLPLDLVHGEGKSRGRSSAAGSVTFNDRYTNRARDSVDAQQNISRTKMTNSVKNPDLYISHKDTQCLHGSSDALPKILDIEEGQVLTDDIVEDAVKNNIPVSGNLPQTGGINRLGKKNETQKNVECSNPRILEVIAKMEKRRERFKEPIATKDKLPELIATKDKLPEPLTGSAENASVTMKQQRPARKRRWGGH